MSIRRILRPLEGGIMAQSAPYQEGLSIIFFSKKSTLRNKSHLRSCGYSICRGRFLRLPVCGMSLAL